MDGLFVDLTCEYERVVAQIGIHLERAGENSANDVFEEIRVVMRLVDDEELVGSLEQVVGFARHGVFDDFNEIFGTDDVGLPLGDADENASPASLVVRGDGQHVKRAPRVGLGEAGLDQLMHGMLAYHVLRARAGGHAFGLDSDDTPRSALVGVRDPDERIRLFAALSADRRPSLQTEPGAQAHVGPDRTLTLDDLTRDRFGEPLDARGFVRLGQHFERRFLENFGKARHMNSGPVRGEIGDHRKLGVVDRGAPVDFQMNDAPHPRDAGATERKPNFRLLRLTIGIEPQPALPPPHEPVGRNVDELWRYLSERNGIIRTSVELLLHDLSVVNQKIDVDRTRLEPARPTRSADRKLYVAREARKVLRIELGAQRCGNVQVGRPLRSTGGLGFVKGRYGKDLRARPQTLQRGEYVCLSIAEVRADADVKVMHGKLSSIRWRNSHRTHRIVVGPCKASLFIPMSSIRS